jgi:hypothetical protein
MSIVNVSLDTKSRVVVLTIDGIQVPQDGCSIDRWINMDGEEHISFSYTRESVNGSGLTERHQFSLPTPEELAVVTIANVDKDGLVSKIVYNDEKAKADIIDFLKKKRNP